MRRVADELKKRALSPEAELEVQRKCAREFAASGWNVQTISANCPKVPLEEIDGMVRAASEASR